MARRVWLSLAMLAAGALAACALDERDEAFVSALRARGYYDLLEVQYNDWLGAPGLTAEQTAELQHGLIRVYTDWAEAVTDPNQKGELWDRALAHVDRLLAGKLSSQDRVRLELDRGIVFLNRGNADLPAAAGGSEAARARAQQNLAKSVETLKSAKEEAIHLLEESFALGGDNSGPRRRLVEMTLESDFRLGWALYGLAKTTVGDKKQKQELLAQAQERFAVIAQSCPGTSAADEADFGTALCRHEFRDLAQAEAKLRNVVLRAKDDLFRKRVYYQLALVSQEMDKWRESVDAANAALRILPGANPEIENGCRLAAAKSLCAAAAIGKGPTAEKMREEGLTILRRLDSLGGQWAAAARQVMITQGAAEAGRYKELAEAETKIQKGNYGAALKNLEQFLALSRDKADPALSTEVLYKMGICFSNLGEHGKAAKSFHDASTGGGSPDLSAQAAYFAMASAGNQFSKTKRKADGDLYIEMLKDLLQRFPAHAERNDTRYRLGRILEEGGELEEATAAYEQVDRDSPLRRRAADRAAACVEKILRRSWDKGPPLKAEAGLVAKAKALLEEASAPLGKEALTSKEDREANAIAAAARVRLARFYLNDRVNDPLTAAKLLADFAQNYPREQDALEDAAFVEASALGKAGNLDAALRTLRQAQVDFPKSGRVGPAAVTLALGLEKRAKNSKDRTADADRKMAAELFKLALASPTCGEDESVQMWLHLADLYSESSDWQHARDAYLNLQKLHPNALNVRQGLARSYTGLGEFAKALGEWRAVEQGCEAGSDPWWEAKYMIVLMHYRMRNYDEALKVISVTKALRPSLGGPKLSKEFLELEKRCSK